MCLVYFLIQSKIVPISEHEEAKSEKNIQCTPSAKVDKRKSDVTSIGFKNKGAMACTFCFGKACKHEDWTRCKNPAIRGLHS